MILLARSLLIELSWLARNAKTASTSSPCELDKSIMSPSRYEVKRMPASA